MVLLDWLWCVNVSRLTRQTTKLKLQVIPSVTGGTVTVNSEGESETGGSKVNEGNVNVKD